VAQGLVVEDVASHLPHFMLHLPHIMVRRLEGELVRDAQLKLRCANATHTAVVYTMALSGCTSVAAAFAAHPRLLLFLDSLYHADISSLAPSLQLPEADVLAFYTEWRARVAAPSVEMSPFWVAQNAVAKVRRACAALRVASHTPV
jgi:mannitol-1-phosphate/altronate dehydrogenase